jgi:hypothetical protein
VPRLYFPEPSQPDDTYARRRETRASFLARSRWDRAAETRAFYNHSLAALPERCAEALHRRLRADNTEAPTFEMMVGRFLQLRGAAGLDCEEAGPGRHPDWRATFPDGSMLHVEATVPVYNAVAGTQVRRHDRLLDALEERVLAGWWLNALHLPDLPESAPLRPFKAEVERLLAMAPPASSVKPGDRVELRGEVWDQRLELSLVRTEKAGGLGLQGGIAYFDNSELRIIAVWNDKRKRAQGRSVLPPALLAIQGGFGGADLEDFANALFGRDVNGGVEPTGVMIEDDPPWAGVLAFPSLSPAGAGQPVLFVAPRYAGPRLPAALKRLEVHRLVGNSVAVEPARDQDAWHGMRWALAEGRAAG